MGFAHYLSQENPQTCDLCTSKNKTVLKKKKTYPIQPYYLIGQSDHSSEVKRHYYFLS